MFSKTISNCIVAQSFKKSIVFKNELIFLRKLL